MKSKAIITTLSGTYGEQHEISTANFGPDSSLSVLQKQTDLDSRSVSDISLSFLKRSFNQAISLRSTGLAFSLAMTMAVTGCASTSSPGLSSAPYNGPSVEATAQEKEQALKLMSYQLDYEKLFPLGLSISEWAELSPKLKKASIAEHDRIVLHFSSQNPGKYNVSSALTEAANPNELTLAQRARIAQSGNYDVNPVTGHATRNVMQDDVNMEAPALQMVLTDLYNNKRKENLSDVAFSIQPGETKEVELYNEETGRKSSKRIFGYYDEIGMSVYFSEYNSHPDQMIRNSMRDGNALHFTERDAMRGISFTNAKVGDVTFSGSGNVLKEYGIVDEIVDELEYRQLTP
ncbi:MAG: hypothetical protein IBX55_01450 [Methyloprofundus sp.]|nr:hypothetical protein [Methyloprofundus sp.]